MFVRLLLFLGILGLVAAPSPAWSAADTTTPTLVVRMQSLDELLANARYLAGVAGREREVKQFDEQIKKVFPNGFPGIDTKRPLGAYGRLDPDASFMDSTALVLVPVADEKDFIGLLENVGHQKLTKEDDGVYNFTLENLPVPVYFRFAHKYAYITIRDKSALDKDKLLEPGKVLSAAPAGTASVVFRLSQIPNGLKQIMISQTELRLADVEDQKPEGETATQHAFKVQAIKEIGRQFTDVVKDGGELAVRFDIDRQAGELSAELALSGKPESTLAARIAALGKTESLFAGLLSPDAAVNALIHGALPESLHKGLGQVIDEGIRSGLEKENDEAKRAQAAKLLKALAPSLKAAELDAGFSLRGPTGEKLYTVVAGLKLKDGEAIDQALRDLLKTLPEKDREKIKVDAETAGETKIHRLEAQKEFDANAKQVLGDNPVFVAIRNDALFLAGGAAGLDALKEALAVIPKTAPQVKVEVSLAHLASLIRDNPKVDADRIARKVFRGAQQDQDKVRLTLEGGKALKIHVAMNALVVKFLSLVEQEKKASE